MSIANVIIKAPMDSVSGERFVVINLQSGAVPEFIRLNPHLRVVSERNWYPKDGIVPTRVELKMIS